jgi:ADP-ribosylglycohydrolase
VLAIRAIIYNIWNGDNNLLEIILPEMPDTRVRDRLLEINQLDITTIKEVGKFGTSGYVVNSIPFAIYAASRIRLSGFETIIREVIECGGDTDTNASIAGQIAGTLITIDNIPPQLSNKLMDLNEYGWIKNVIDRTSPLL